MARALIAEEKINRLPASPGVYLMKNRKGDVIYIGKAKSLQIRVKSYFTRIEDSRYLIRFLLSQAEDIDCIITDTEKEALILENNLIKKHKPRYNVNLKDDKTYFSLRFNIQDEFPRLSLVRKVKKDGARYFGPYSSSYAVKDTLKMVSRIFHIRGCSDSNFKNRSRPCLSYQIRRCLAPCCKLVDWESYRKYVREATLFLEGKNQELLRLLKKSMKHESDNLNFEEAARFRDHISSIEKTIERQKVVSNLGTDQDVFAFYREEGVIEFQLMIMRGGRVLDTLAFSMTNLRLPDNEVMSSFLKQYYGEDRSIPSEIVIPIDIEDRKLLEEWFSEKKGKKVRIHIPKKGEKLKLLRMVMENAKNSFMDKQREKGYNLKALEEIQKRLHLKRLPRKIECFDISNISGKLAVGSMVIFKEGIVYKNGYRHFKIKTVNQADDCGMMYEVIKRRYRRVFEKNDMPDLIMVDGGKGQLNVAVRVLKELKKDDADAISLAKGGDREKVFIPHRKNPIILQKDSKALLLLQQIRDEAHRFALTYHQNLRRKQNLRSILEDIPGVGLVRKKALLKHFGSLKSIKDASINELTTVPGMNIKAAENVFVSFQSFPSDPESLQ
ncbi:MAG: excinuclease ABC subunit UvrC [Thermodesulfobacteriota bacterium]